MGNGINWEEVDRAQSEDELRRIKLWLFQENIRLQNERDELEDMQDKLLKEQARFREEMEALSRRIALEPQRRLNSVQTIRTKYDKKTGSSEPVSLCFLMDCLPVKSW